MTTEALQRILDRVDAMAEVASAYTRRRPNNDYARGQYSMAKAIALIIRKELRDGKGMDDE